MPIFLSPEDIVKRITHRLDEGDIETLSTTPKEDLGQYHMSVGRVIRNDYLMWHPDNPYTDNYDPTGELHADQLSMKIIEQVWEQLHTTKQKGVIK